MVAIFCMNPGRVRILENRVSVRAWISMERGRGVQRCLRNETTKIILMINLTSVLDALQKKNCQCIEETEKIFSTL